MNHNPDHKRRHLLFLGLFLAVFALALVLLVDGSARGERGRPILPVSTCQAATGVRPSVGVYVKRLERSIRCLERRLERKEATIQRLRDRLATS
jgi:hypothetical protein